MGNKTVLVAHREYMENLRTKTFWVGIFFFPIIISLSIVIPIWLEKTKDVRKYAVIDNSGWLAQAVEDAAKMPDLRRVFDTAVDAFESEDQAGLDDYPEAVRAVAEMIAGGKTRVLDELGDSAPNELADMDDAEFRRVFIRSSVEAIELVDTPQFDQLKNLGLFPKEAFDEIIQQRNAIKEWYDALTPKEAKRFGTSLDKAKYEQIEIDGEGEELLSKLNKMIDEEELFAYVVIGEDPLASNEGSKYISNNLTDKDVLSRFERYGTNVLRERRLEEEGIDPEVSARIQAPLELEMKQVSETGEEKEVEKTEIVRQWAPVAFVYLLWMAVFSISQMLLTNTIEEKSNRILEVLLSSVSPLQLMSGKILGIMWTGLTMILSWVVSAIVLVTWLPGLFGASTGNMPDFASIARDPFLLTSFVVYFSLGYLFFAALLVGIGSVCNTVKEANNLMMPVTVMLMMPLLAMIPISKDPNGTLAVFLSYIPPFTPFVMMNRAAGPPELHEYVLTSILLIGSIILVFWGAAKIFRIGILMTGKPPSPLEMLKWLRAPVGQVPVRADEEE